MTIRTALVVLALALLVPTAASQDADEVDREFNVYVHEPFHLLPERMTVQEGETVRFRIVNGNPNPHDLVVCGDGVEAGPECDDVWGFTTLAPNSEAVLVFTAKKAGTFEYYCTLTGHKQGGMKGELLVQGDANAKKETPSLPLAAALGALGAAALACRRTLR